MAAPSPQLGWLGWLVLGILVEVTAVRQQQKGEISDETVDKRPHAQTPLRTHAGGSSERANGGTTCAASGSRVSVGALYYYQI